MDSNRCLYTVYIGISTSDDLYKTADNVNYMKNNFEWDSYFSMLSFRPICGVVSKQNTIGLLLYPELVGDKIKNRILLSPKLDDDN